jgi:carboxymethylenebutenolidase
MHSRREFMDQVNPTNILGDVAALLEVADADPDARDGNVGAVGFCMSGGLVISAARALPERIAAVASIHGAWLVKDSDDSPHRGLDSVQAEIYFGWCDNDATAPAEDVPVMEQALKDAEVNYTLDWLTEAVHGYAPPHSDRYDRTASELHWERVHSLFRRNL